MVMSGNGFRTAFRQPVTDHCEGTIIVSGQLLRRKVQLAEFFIRGFG
jgi:hypothetical protein